MHDRNGTELKLGDFVMVPMIVAELYPGADFCNVTLKSVHGRKPDGMHETMVGNTAVVVLMERGDK